MLQAAFQPDGPGQLPPDMTEGHITLLYKGKGLDRALPASYRPITLLNTDYKLAARVLADRLGPLLNHVVDSTQTGFLPQRWIGDNILAHLEIIAWYQRTQQPGVLLFLDFEKAFDRLDRPWLQRCMAATGFGAGAQRWVSLMHASTSAKVAFNGWHTQRFPVQSGVFQGSPLSPLLFVLAVQPSRPSTDAPWMHRSQPRPAPVRDRRPPQLSQQSLRPTQRVRAALRSDETDIASLAEAHPSSPEWAHTWRAATSAALDRPGRVVVWRLLHGKLFVGAFHRHIHRGTPESHLCPHAAC